MIKWVEKGQALDKSEVRGKSKEVLVARSKFNPALFKMRDGVLMCTKRAGEIFNCKKIRFSKENDSYKTINTIPGEMSL